MELYRNYRPSAIREIAFLYFNNKNYKKALESITEAKKYSYVTFCGNCASQYSWENAKFIGSCYEKLGETDKTVELYSTVEHRVYIEATTYL